MREQLADPAASLAVVFGAGGVLESTRRGYAYIDHSTIDEATGDISSAASLGFTDYLQGDTLVLRCKFVNFGAGKSLAIPEW